MYEEPEIALIAGPNGSGKSTLARLLIPEAMPFLNADEIAKSLAAETGGAAGDFEAGKRLLTAMDYYTRERRSFAAETTLASKTLAPRIREWKAAGYGFRLIFIYSPSVELCIARVAERVRRGGHDIPEATIRRRYAAGLRNFNALYRPLADFWSVHTNLFEGASQVIAAGDAFQCPCARRFTMERDFEPNAMKKSVFEDTEEISRRFTVAVREALLDHKRAGNPVAVWRDGKVVIVPPEEIAVESVNPITRDEK